MPKKNIKKKILVIEDSDSLSKIIKMKLEEAGYLVLLSQNGEDGLEKVTREKPDLVWLDIYLPGMNGLELLEKIRKNPATKGQKTIIVSVSGNNKKIEIAEKLGVIDYYVKSNYKIEELVSLVNGIFKDIQKNKLR